MWNSVGYLPVLFSSETSCHWGTWGTCPPPRQYGNCVQQSSIVYRTQLTVSLCDSGGKIETGKIVLVDTMHWDRTDRSVSSNSVPTKVCMWFPITEFLVTCIISLIISNLLPISPPQSHATRLLSVILPNTAVWYLVSNNYTVFQKKVHP